MRVHVMSDIHFEHMQDKAHFFQQHKALQARDPADFLILAGDICQIGRRESFWKANLARLIGGYKKVLYVPGNHEYYDYTFQQADQFFEEIEGNPNFYNLVQLDYGPVEVEGIRFIGNTMWFPNKGTPYTKRMMSDFDVIGNFEPQVYERHQEFLSRVVENLRSGDVVVTHHLPLPACVSPEYAGSLLNPFFMADMTANLHEGRLPRVWIFGHTHTPVDTYHHVGTDKMRLYCNPLAYPNEGSNLHFWDRVAIDL
jgi:predicted phosphodiesterase